MTVIKNTTLVVFDDVPVHAQKQIKNDYMGYGSNLMIKKNDTLIVRRRLGGGWLCVYNIRTKGLNKIKLGYHFIGIKVPTKNKQYEMAKKFFTPKGWQVFSRPCRESSSNVTNNNNTAYLCDETTGSAYGDNQQTINPAENAFNQMRDLVIKQKEENNTLFAENNKLKESLNNLNKTLLRNNQEISGLNDRLIEIKEENYQRNCYYDKLIDDTTMSYLTKLGYIGHGYAVVPNDHVYIFYGPHRSKIVKKDSNEFNETIQYKLQDVN